MSHTLAIVWDRPHLLAVAGSPSGGPQRVDMQGVCKVDVEPELTDAEAAEKLLSEVRAAGLLDGASSLVAVVPRDRAAFRVVDAPPMPEGELPNVARLQFSTQLAAAAESYAVDFVPTKTDAGHRLAVVGVPNALVALMRSVAERAGVPLGGVYLSSGCLAALAPDDAAGLVVVGPSEAETLVLDGGQVANSTGRRHDRGDSARDIVVDSELRKLRLSAGDGPVYVLGPWVSDADAKSHLPEVHSDLGVGPPSYAAVGAIADPASAGRWNFAAPREPAPPVNHRKTLFIGAGVAAAALIGLFAFSLWEQVSDLDADIDRYRRQIADSEAFLKEKGDTRKRAKELSAYLDRRPPVDVVLRDVINAMPDRERLLFADFDVYRRSAGDVATVKGTVYGKDRRDLERFAGRLDESGYPATATAITAADDRPGFAVKQELELPVRKSVLKSAATTSNDSEAADGNA